jgi:two-component system invasion response regulator UvrY
MEINSASPVKVVLADDHLLLRNALASLINEFDNCRVIFHCNNGQEMIDFFKGGAAPDVAILDLNMPLVDGFDTADWIRQNHPSTHILMLTMFDSELSLIRLLQCGAKGFLKKDVHPDELKTAIQSVMTTGYYYSNHTTGKIVNLFRNTSDGKLGLQRSMLTDMEVAFLRLACSDMTYKEVAQKMHLNPRAVDTLRDGLFTKLDVKSRVGLALVAIKQGIVRF